MIAVNDNPLNDFLGWASKEKNAAQSFESSLHDYKANYFAGGHDRYLPMPSGINPLGSGADSHYAGSEMAYFLMTERARAEDRDNMIFGQALNRLVANVLQGGLNLDVSTGDSALDTDLFDEFQGWAKDKKACDYYEENTFQKQASLVFRHQLVDGDTCVLPLKNGQLQHKENHHLRSPFGVKKSGTSEDGIVHGVEVKNSKTTAYYLTPESIGAYSGRRFKYRRIAKYDSNGMPQLFHIKLAKRVAQRRGVTVAAPIVFPLKYHDDLQFANLVNSKRQNFYAIIEERSKEWVPDGKRNGGNAEPEKEYDRGGPGQRIIGKAGAKVSPWAPNTPTAQFMAHAHLLMSIVSVNLDLPLLVMLLDAAKINFNNYRAVIDQARLRFSTLITDFTEDYYTPAYLHWLAWKLSTDPIFRRAARRSDVKIRSHRWRPKAWGYTQPVHDATANEIRDKGNQASKRRLMHELGIEWPQESKAICDDRALHIMNAIEVAQKINGKHKDAVVTWREIAYGTDSKIKMNINMDAGGGTQDDAKDDKKGDDNDGK